MLNSRGKMRIVYDSVHKLRCMQNRHAQLTGFYPCMHYTTEIVYAETKQKLGAHRALYSTPSADTRVMD